MAWRGDLHCPSTASSAGSTSLSCRLSQSGGSDGQGQPQHPLTATSIKQKRDLESVRTNCASKQSEQNWIEVYSLKSLKLTLDHIMEHCKLPRQRIVVEFPFSQYLTVLNTVNRESPASPSRPEANVDKKKLAAKVKELKMLVKFYKKRIHWLSRDSRLVCGLLQGSSVAIVVESSQCLAELERGDIFKQYKDALKLLVEDQLVSKKMVYLVKYGNSASPTKPQGLPFTKFKAECVKYATDWLASLEGEGGKANLLEALKLALELPDVDTLCVILSTKPNQPLDIISNYMIDKLSGENAPKLHIVAINASQEIKLSLSGLARECQGHFHSHTIQHDIMQWDTASEETRDSVQDTDIERVREEVVKAQDILCDLKNLEHGSLGQQLMETLRELSLTTDWEEDDDFTLQSPPSGDHCIVCPTSEWILHHGIESQRLNLYRHLAPDAYPQLEGYVQVTDGYVVSQVYNVMPLIPWDDGSFNTSMWMCMGWRLTSRLLSTS